MNKLVFLDTNGWIALLNSRDLVHRRAGELWKQLGSDGYSVVVTDWIIAETGNGLARGRSRKAFVQTVATVKTSSRSNLVFVTDALLERSLNFYAQRDDKTWGLVDCSSFLVMQDHGVREAFSNDKHFEQAGFECLLSDD